MTVAPERSGCWPSLGCIRKSDIAVDRSFERPRRERGRPFPQHELEGARGTGGRRNDLHSFISSAYCTPPFGKKGSPNARPPARCRIPSHRARPTAHPLTRLPSRLLPSQTPLQSLPAPPWAPSASSPHPPPRSSLQSSHSQHLPSQPQPSPSPSSLPLPLFPHQPLSPPRPPTTSPVSPSQAPRPPSPHSQPQPSPSRRKSSSGPPRTPSPAAQASSPPSRWASDFRPRRRTRTLRTTAASGWSGLGRWRLGRGLRVGAGGRLRRR